MSKNILIVDDEPNIRDLLSKYFRKIGYSPYVAQDAKEAFLIMQQEDIEIVFLDIKLPGVSGVEILKQLRELNKNIHVIMISGHADEDTAKETLKLGAFDYIHKPIDLLRLDELLAQIEISKFTSC
ncbi:MAG: response regulator [Calditrichaeota bacterium]|nr:MAG: response regulator [Calditrichota bacterium]